MTTGSYYGRFFRWCINRPAPNLSEAIKQLPASLLGAGKKTVLIDNDSLLIATSEKGITSAFEEDIFIAYAGDITDYLVPVE